MGELEKKTRNHTADFLKGVMILCVMYGHSISMINSLRGANWQESIVNVFLTSFEMPLFILISGYFLWFSLSKKPHLHVLRKRVISIILPLLVWDVFPVVFQFRYEIINTALLLSIAKRMCYRLVFPALWFLGCYLICTGLVIVTEWVISKIHHEKARGTLGVIIYILWITGLHCINLSFNNVPFMFPFFLVGFILSKYNLLKNKTVRRIIWGLAVLFIVLYPFYSPEISFYTLGSYLLDNTLIRMPIFFYRFVLGLAGCSFFYLIADRLCRKAAEHCVVSLIIKFGNKTMELYILSMFVQEILIKLVKMLIQDVSVITDITAPLLLGPLFLIVMSAICMLIDYFIHKWPKLHRVIFGR